MKHPQYPIISPDGDGHARRRSASPTRSASRRTRSCFVRGEQVEFTRTQKPSGELVWNGKQPKTGKPLPPGRYVLAIAAQDTAGNRSKAFPFAIVQIRYVALARTRIVVRAGRPVRAARARPTRRTCTGRCTAGRGASRAARSTCARREAGRLPPVRHACAPTRRVHGGRRMNVGRCAGRRRGRRARARAARRRAAPRAADRRARRLGGRLRGARRLPRAARPSPPDRRRRGRRRRSQPRSAPGSSCACRGCSRSRRSRASRRGSRCTSARRRRTCCCRSTASSPSRRSRSRGSSSATSRSVRASSGRSRGRSRCSSAGIGCRFSGRRTSAQGAIELLFFVLPFGLLARRARAPALVARLGADALRPARGDGARLRGDRDRAVRDAQHLLEPEGAASTTPTRRAAGSTASTRCSTTRRSTGASSSSRSSRASRSSCVAAATRCGDRPPSSSIVITWVGPRCRRSRSRASSRSIVGDRGRARRRSGGRREPAARRAPASRCCSSQLVVSAGTVRRQGVALARHERALDARLERRSARRPPSRRRRRCRAASATRTRSSRTCAGRSRRRLRRTRRRSPSPPRRASRASLLFAWLVVAALARRLRAGSGDGFDGAARLAFGLALVAILVHSLFYNALFEDPLVLGPARARRSSHGAPPEAPA